MTSNASPFPWKTDAQFPRFIVDDMGGDVCVVTGEGERLVANRARILATGPLTEALQALGIHPFQMEDGTPAHGYCFCPQPHPGVPEDEHTGECRDARKALKAAGVPLVTVSPGEADAAQRAKLDRAADTVARQSAP